MTPYSSTRSHIHSLLPLCVLVALFASAEVRAQNPIATSNPQQPLVIEDLLSSPLEVVDGIEVILSRVIIPPNTSLPMHWHPGEEFAYVLEGSVVLVQEGKDDKASGVGEVAVVPLEQIHTARTTEEGATILVFRVHKEGEPGRTIVE